MQIKVNVGAVALEYEGPEDFFKSEIANIMKTLSAHAAAVPPAKPLGPSNAEGGNGGGGGLELLFRLIQQVPWPNCWMPSRGLI